jgi:transcriptional regulator GlxA family with amidase domain
MGATTGARRAAASPRGRKSGLFVIAATSALRHHRDMSSQLRRVAMVVFPDVQILDVTGPLEVFARTARWLVDHGRCREPAYAVELLAARRGIVRSSSGLELVIRRPFAEARRGIDTLLVAGGVGARRVPSDRALVGWLRRAAPRVRRLASVCTGAFLLAEAGLLDGRRATTHWGACALLAARYPKVSVEADPIFVRDGRVYTSAGVTAGMDLALALVEEDHGREVAVAVARELVMFLKRPGGQSQFSIPLMAQTATRQPLGELQEWIGEHPGADLSVAALARRAAMSLRNFARVFTREVGMTPARFVERARVEAARRRLEESAAGIEAVASQCGFSSAEIMRRAFLRTVHVNPAEYRHRFRIA